MGESIMRLIRIAAMTAAIFGSVYGVMELRRPVPAAAADEKKALVLAPVIPAEIQKAWERARANERETNAVHEQDVAKLEAAYQAVVGACGEGFDVQKPQRDGDLICVAKPAPPEDTKKKP